MATRIPVLDLDALDAISAVRAACREGDEADPLDEAAQLRLRHHGLAGGALWLAGREGFALILDHEGGTLHGLDLAVAPAARGQGHGAALLSSVVSEYVGPLVAWSHGDHPAARSLAVREGFERTRELWVMRRPMSPLPDGSDAGIRSFRPGDEDDVVRVNAAAFAHHPEQGAMTRENLAERMGEPWFDPDGLLVHEHDGGIDGFHWTKVHDHGAGEVYVVGIDPSAQGRGLGRALTLAGLRHLEGQGVDEVILYVESDNLPARKVYDSLGFTHAESDTHVQYRRG